jgi:hypothetical protein
MFDGFPLTAGSATIWIKAYPFEVRTVEAPTDFSDQPILGGMGNLGSAVSVGLLINFAGLGSALPHLR